MSHEYSDQHYVDDSVLLDGLLEFHPGFFSELNAREWQVLQQYYLTGQDDIPENVLEYRRQLARERPELEARAREVFSKVCRVAGMTERAE